MNRVRGRIRNRLASIAAALALATAGCISVDEEVALKPDGRVQYKIDFTLLEMVVLGLAELGGESTGTSIASEWLAAVDSTAGDSLRHREFVDAKDHHFVAERDFASLEHLAILSARAAVPDSDRAKGRTPELPMGGIEVTRLDGRRVRLRRTLENPSAGMPEGAPDSSSAQAKRMFADRFYVFRLRAPAIESASGVIAADRKSVEWRIPMADLDKDSAVVVEAILIRGK